MNEKTNKLKPVDINYLLWYYPSSEAVLSTDLIYSGLVQVISKYHLIVIHYMN